MLKMRQDHTEQGGKRRQSRRNNQIIPKSMPRNRNKTPDQKVSEILKKHLKGGETLICSVSGGSDSVFLLDCLVKFKEETPINIVVAHINHSLRGREAELDTEFVENIAKKSKLTFKSTKVDTLALAKTTKSSIEEAGREIRYNFLLKLFKKHKADYVLTAHHADDNLETILLNFIRGSQLKGLSGMKETTTKKNGMRVLRPLLCVSKKEIREYLKKNTIPNREDRTNMDTTIPRNFLRHDVIPKLKKLNPNLQQTVLRNSKNIKEVHQLLAKQAEDWIQKNNLSNLSKFDLKSIQTLSPPIQREILRRIYKKKEGHTKNIESIHIDEVLEIINKNIGRKQKKLGKYTVEINKGTFILN